MHFSDFPPRSAPARLALLTVCALLPAFTREAAASAVSVPYLLVGPPPRLRFAEPVKRAPPVASPTAMLDPPPADDLQQAVATPDSKATETPSDPLTADASTAPTTALPLDSPAPGGTDALAIPTAPPQVGISILPDDTPRSIRAEDVLVYFQFPAAPPSGDSPPRSSATYQQQ